MRVAIVGSREFDDYELLKETVNNLKLKITTVVSGGARGADRLAERYAKEYGIELLIFKADWDKLGKGAGFARNQTIIDNVDHLVAFWDGHSTGTMDIMKKAYKKNIPVIFFTVRKK
jgi:hypothetical protein